MNTIARDVRSPLTAILGYVELLERIGTLSEQQHDFVGRIIFSVHSITAMLTNAMELEKIEAGMDTGKEVIAIERIVSYTLEGLKKRIDGRHQTCEVVADEPLPQVWGNPIRLRQLTTALLENAIKYTPEGGAIRVEVYAESDFIILMVSDNGIGISPDEQPYIFEKFYRASNANDSSVGTGLGLSIVQSIVEQHDGRIWVESQPNEGTTFTVMLPCYVE
jgi:two-component system NtrC family sensor kinase